MGAIQRPNAALVRNTMRPPPKPSTSNYASITGRAPSPADSILISTQQMAGVKRKEREYDHDDGEETNIHVVVRCRGRSEREVRENSGVVVSTNGMRGKTVELSMGPNAISNKTYHFDKVFSPAADQAIIFEDVVAPILNEMLAGFNCTIFAYGQTGTGKTYTMSGDMTDTLGLLSDAAGVIPRVLYSLFHKLESDEVECSVKCSFIELYNEELRDLLSADDSIKLKIYDDANKKGHTATMVHGMEESHIKNAADGVKLLQEGSHRRQVAATKCNDLSSRSHTVFTITTYIKKSGDTGEDYICSGKLNLVDLAGSENIQRSGAENKRAAEAGLINKSLLTLGRVINALVDKSSHIPYRESKLTRLLQDSLGGRTKTCIIATVSPAKSNLEETISTLDYAFRAKNIRNKPQVNSMISKKTLLKEFTSEIEKLKGELIATRQRNGVYLSNEQYEVITVESESRRILSEEQKARIETMEANLRNKVQDLFNLTNNFTVLKRDNEATKSALEGTKDVLIKTEMVLKDTQQLLDEEKILREAHESTEIKLRQIGSTLVSTIGETVKDLDGVHSKLRRRSDLHNHNQQLWQSSTQHVSSLSSQIDKCLGDFESLHKNLLINLSAQVQAFASTESKKLQECNESLLSRSLAIEETENIVIEQSSSARDSMNNVLEEIKALREEVKEKVGEGLKSLNDAAARICGEVISEMGQFHTQLHTSYSGLGKEFKAVFEDITKQLVAQTDENDRLKRELQEANRKNIEASLSASTQLQLCLEEERQAAEQERQRLKEQICLLIDSSSKHREERLEMSLLKTQKHLVESTEAFESADAKFSTGMDRWALQHQHLLDDFSKSKDELKGRMKRDWIDINAHHTAIQASTKAVHAETVKIVDTQIQEMASQMTSLDEFVTRARSQNDVHHDNHVEHIKQATQSAKEAFRDLSQELNNHDSSIGALSSQHASTTKELERSLSSIEREARQSLQALATEMSATTMQEYIPIGETPQKKDWTYPTTLPATENHQSILARMHGLPDPNMTSRTPLQSYTPARSPRKLLKQKSPQKANSPTKISSPTKAQVYNDNLENTASTITIPVTQHHSSNTDTLKEIDVNIVPRPASAADMLNVELPTNGFSKSVGSGQPPLLKRHATASAVLESKLPMSRSKGKSTIMPPGLENLGQSLGISAGAAPGRGRWLRSTPPQ